MDPEIISSTKQRFNGVTYYYDGKYFTNKWKDKLRLHQRVWEHHNGHIPQGWHVHHKNGDKTDNRLENLECLSAADHMRLHPNTKPFPKAALVAAAAEKKTPAARARARQTMLGYKFKRHQFRCIQCNKIFTASRNPSGMCGQTCRKRHFIYKVPGGKGGIWYD